MLEEAQLMSMLESGREPEVRALLEAQLKRRPGDVVANKVMAMIHGAHMEDDKAVVYIQRAAYNAPRDGSIRFMLANVLMSLRRHKESLAAYKECLKLAPNNVAAADGAGKCLISLGKLDEAKVVFESAIAANPDVADAYGNYATALVHTGKPELALKIADRGLQRLPDHASLLEFVAYTSNFPCGVDNTYVRSVHERWGKAITRERAGALARVAPFTNSKDPSRPLRVGFMSGDYSLHACALFMAGPLLNFDRSAVVPVCYSTVAHSDGGDSEFRTRCEFHDLAEMDSDAINAAIRANQIDILIECSGLTQGQRLRALVPRAAPVQATWLGYPNTTGVSTIDYRIIDEHTDPPGYEKFAVERLARIDGCFLCFKPDRDTPEPALTTATMSKDSVEPIIFGSFNRMTKVNDETIEAWSSVLRAVPNSRMLVKLRIMSEELRLETAARFTSRGVDASRILTVPFTTSSREHALMYSKMDIALDAFPYNGTTTTCEASWMGVPVIVLAGDSHRSRVGVSLNAAMGQTDLIARDVEDYVAIAVRLSSDREALGRRRLGLRSIMDQSILTDAPGYARRFERVLREMWKAYCRGEVGA